MYKWYVLSKNGGQTAVRAKSPEEAIKRFAAHGQELRIPAGMKIKEVSDKEAEKIYLKIS